MIRSIFAVITAAFILTGVYGELSAQDFDSVRHRVTAGYTGVDPFGDDPPVGLETITSRQFAPFRGDLDIGEGGVQAECSLDSNLDERGSVFWAYGYAAAGLYVQGSASTRNTSDFRTDFTLGSPGSIVLQGNIGVSQFLGSQITRDEPGVARVLVLIRRIGGQSGVVFRKQLRMNGYIDNASGIIDFDFDDLEVNLPAGSYRLIINARAEDSADNAQVEGSLAVAYFELEGSFDEN